MKIKLTDYIANFFVNNNIKHIFTVTGGGAMHLNDSFGHNKDLKCIYNHHEQASAIAAEGYARLSNKLPVVCVTSGPGGTNAITGVIGAWFDSIPMMVISGQVKRETTIWNTNIPLRQLGDQEADIISIVKSITKYSVFVSNPLEIKYHLQKALYLAKNGRPGPVWLDIPLDVQSTMIETKNLIEFDIDEIINETPIYDVSITSHIFEKIKKSTRPVIMVGSGVRLGNAHEEFLKAIDKLQIPVVTAWNAHDELYNEHPLYCGRPGTVGTRGGNFVVQNCDLLLVLGCRLNIRQISYNYKDFAPNAYKIMVDIDKYELKKPTLDIDMPIHADILDVLNSFNNTNYNNNSENHKKWLEWCRKVDKKYPVTLDEYYNDKELNPYVFITELSKELKNNEKIICGNGSACVISFQAFEIKKYQRLFTNSGCAAMGYGFPAALGAAVAENDRVICIDGDGSFQMNIQELQTIIENNLNIKIFYINNNGYHSIRQTQNNIFNNGLVGVCKGNGISFPNIKKIVNAYGIKYYNISSEMEIHTKVQKMLNEDGPVLCEVVVNPQQNFVPKCSSKRLDDGTIVSAPLDDLYPFLPSEERTEIYRELVLKK